MWSRTGAVILLSVSASIGCEGTIESPSTPPDPNVPDGSLPTFPCETPGRVDISAVPLARMSREELALSLIALFGTDLVAAVASQLDAFPDDQLRRSVDDFSNYFSTAHARAIVSLSEAIAQRVVGTDATLAALAGNCAIELAPSAACTEEFIATFGRRAFRRPITDDEAAMLQDLYAEGSSPREGFELVVMAVLQAPPFLFHIELEGEETQENAIRKLRVSDDAVAARISYWTTGGPPDQALRDAVDAGTLSTLEQARAHVERLAQTDAFRVRLTTLFHYFLLESEASEVPRHEAFLSGISPDGLQEELFAERDRFVDYVLWDTRGSARDLTLSTAAFPHTDRLANIYGVSRWVEGSAPPEVSERPGLFLRAASLLQAFADTSPMRRGAFVRTRILCEELPPPPVNAVNARLAEVHIDPLTQSGRERARLITEPEGCMSCHSQINPPGFALENFDSIGRFRTAERVFDDQGVLVATHPIDPVVTLALGSGNEATVSSPRELAELLSNSPQVIACIAQRAFEVTRRRSPGSTDACVVEDLRDALVNGSIVQAFIDQIANDSLFSRRLD